jgi:hypothetical protein
MPMVRKTISQNSDRTAGERFSMNGTRLVIGGVAVADAEIAFDRPDADRYPVTYVRDIEEPAGFSAVYLFHGPNNAVTPPKIDLLAFSGDAIPHIHETAPPNPRAIVSGSTANAQVDLLQPGPTARIRIYGFEFTWAGHAAQAAAGLNLASLRAGAAGLYVHRDQIWVPAASANVLGGYSSGWKWLGEAGILLDPGVHLILDLTTALTSGLVTTNVAYGIDAK